MEDEVYGRQLVAMLRARGAQDEDIRALCANLEAGGMPQLTWRTEDVLPDMTVDRGNVSTRLYNLLDTHGLTTHRALQLLSLAELEGLYGFGRDMVANLLGYYKEEGLAPRGDELIAARAVPLFGTILRAPVTIALSIALPKTVCDRYAYLKVRDTITATGAVTIGGLLSLLTERREIPGVSADHRSRLCDWLGTHIFLF